MKSNFRKWTGGIALFLLGVIGVFAFQNCGVVSLSKMATVDISSKSCPDFDSSKPEHIYEDASNQSNIALFKMNELTSNGNLITSQRIVDWALDGVLQGSSRDFSLDISSLQDCRTYEITATISACDEIFVWKKSYMKAGSACPTTTTTTSTTVTTVRSGDPTNARGCTDDPSVPIVREIDFAKEPGVFTPPAPYSPDELIFNHMWDRPIKNKVPASLHQAYCDSRPSGLLYSQVWIPQLYLQAKDRGLYAPTACEEVAEVVAVRLIVPPGGGNWYVGSLQIGPTIGSSSGEGVISRCRGRFDPGGRVHVVRLDNYTGPENQSPITFFPGWVVDATKPLDRDMANLTSQGKQASDGWLSDGVYYINVRQKCSFSPEPEAGICWRSFMGSGSSRQQVGRDL